MTRWQIIKLLISALFNRDMRQVLHQGGCPLGSPYEPAGKDPQPAVEPLAPTAPSNKDPMIFDPTTRKWVRRKI